MEYCWNEFKQHDQIYTLGRLLYGGSSKNTKTYLQKQVIKNILEKLVKYWETWSWISTLYHIQKASNCIMDLNMIGKSIKLREENVVKYFLDMIKNSFDMAKTAQIIRKTIVLTWNT